MRRGLERVASRWGCIRQWDHLDDIALVGVGLRGREWSIGRIGHNVVLCSFPPPTCWVAPVFSRARHELRTSPRAPATIRSFLRPGGGPARSRRRFRGALVCHAPSHFQAVIQEPQPSSRGSYFRGTSSRTTNRIVESTFRLSIGWGAECRERRFFSRNGDSTISEEWSLISGFAIAATPCAGKNI